LRTRSTNFHGFALKEYLERNRIYPELADDQHVLLALSPHTQKNDLNRLLEVLTQVEGIYSTDESVLPSYTFSPEVVLTPSDVVYSHTVRMAFMDAVGRISAEMITPYPPGVPVINPGERINLETMQYLMELKRLGCRFHDISDTSLETILVVDPHS